MYTVIETLDYRRDAKAARLTESEQSHIVNFIAQHPNDGDEIPGRRG
jgi:hypothetical protein